MKKNYILVSVLVVVVAAVALIYFRPKEKVDTQIVVKDYKNTTYTINGEPVTLVNGVSGTTRYFGNEVKHDLNDDGKEDVAFLLTQDNEGSGVFYYVVAALQTDTGYKGSHEFLLGDRIAPQSTNIDEGMTSAGTNRQNVIVVNYAVRLPGEPFTTAPSVGKSVWIKLDPETMQFGEVAHDFEGESR